MDFPLFGVGGAPAFLFGRGVYRPGKKLAGRSGAGCLVSGNPGDGVHLSRRGLQTLQLTTRAGVHPTGRGQALGSVRGLYYLPGTL